jgi:hypothetical protein
MPAGRPVEYTPESEEKEVFGLNVDDLKTDEWGKEIDLLCYITNNIDLFCRDVLLDKLISFETEKEIKKKYKFGPRGQRVDLFINCERSVYIIELKNPKNISENRGAIGQILEYGMYFLDPKKELILLTTKFDIETARIIKFYDLPIRYIYFDKHKKAEFKGFVDENRAS